MSTLNPDQWQALSPYLDQVLGMTDEERAAWLASLRDQNPALADQLRMLLDEHRALVQEGFLEQGPVPLPGAPGLAGQTIGAYTLRSQIGQGGMGSVWLGERSDGRFERRVAVKFLSVALFGREGEGRFKREGSILGRLAHPHIAELVDAGVSPTGQPYLVLEYVEGDHIDRYCDARSLDVQARVRLFLEVLIAVAHAHANLIVHRDLKPSNVLVSKDGQVKLLDFGIAKLLEGQTGEATLLTVEGGRAMTPEYAAPEQLRGEPVTTATDVYALGVLLYVLLTGQHPAGRGPHTPADLVKAIVDTEPTRPSDTVAPTRANAEVTTTNATRRATTPEKLRRLLRGDLDTIVAKALKKNPAERYTSIAALADDLQRYLKHEPISARPETLAYRSGKFVRRNRTMVSLSVAAVILVISSLSAGLYLANRERAIAQRRFMQVRQLANKFIELDEGIRGLPGSTKVRSQIVSDALQYLTALGSEAHGDKDLALEIAFAYVRVAHVQGDPTSPNLGRFADAEATLQKAERFVQSALTADPRNRRGLAIAATVAHDRMMLADVQGRRTETLLLAGDAAARVERLASLDNIEPYVYGMAYFEENVAYTYAANRRFDDALRASRRALEITQPVASAHQLHGDIFGTFAFALWQLGNLNEALTNSRRSIELTEKEAVKDHTAIRSNLASALWREGMLLGKEDAEPSLGRTADALADFQRAMSIAEELAKKDPDDYMSRHEVAEVGLEMGNILRHSNPRKALVTYDHALASIREAKLNPQAQRDQVDLLSGSSYAARWIGRDKETKQRIDTAFQLLRNAHEYPTDKVEPMSELDHALRARADFYAETGQPKKAVEAYQDLLDKLMAWKPDLQNDLRDATCISRTWTTFAKLLRRVGRADEAARLEAQRADLWNHWKSKLPNGEFLLRQSLRDPQSRLTALSAGRVPDPGSTANLQ